MVSIQDIRAQNPQYSDLSDEELATALHAKFYSDWPLDKFMRAVGIRNPNPLNMTDVMSSPEEGPLAQFEATRTDLGNSMRRGATDILEAGTQLAARALPDGVTARIGELNNWLADQGLPLVKLDERGLEGRLADSEAAYQAQRTGKGFDAGRLAGNVGAGMAGAAVLAPAGAATAAGRLGQAVVGGTVGGALSAPIQGNPDDQQFWEEKGMQAGLGAAAGGALGATVEGVGGMARQVTRPDIQTMREMGVTPTVGQTVGGLADKVEQKATAIPFAGDSIAGQRQRTLDEFTTGVTNRALEPVGGNVATTGREAIDDANQLVSQAYKDAMNLVPPLRIDPPMQAQMQAIDQYMDSAPEDMANAYRRYVSKSILPRLENGALTPEDFKFVDSELGEKATFSEKELGKAYSNLQTALRMMAARQSPDFADALGQADGAFARMVRVNDAMGSAAATDTITPAQLLRAAKMDDRSAGRHTSAGGRALMQKEGAAGQRVLGNTVPDSGTPGRLAQMDAGHTLATLGTGAAGITEPMITGASIAGLMGLYTSPVQKQLFALSQALGHPLSPLEANALMGAGGGFFAGQQ